MRARAQHKIHLKLYSSVFLTQVLHGLIISSGTAVLEAELEGWREEVTLCMPTPDPGAILASGVHGLKAANSPKREVCEPGC